MAKEKVGEAPIVEQPEKETPTPEPQTISMTQAELDAKIALATEAGKTEANEEYKGIQRTIAQKDETIEGLRAKAGQPSQPSGNLMRQMIEAMEAGQGEYGDANPKIATLKQAIATEEAREKQAGVYHQQETLSNQERDKMEARIREAKLDPTDEKFEAVWDKWEYGRDVSGYRGFDAANERLNRILKVDKPEVKKESDEEIAARVLKKEGQLDTDTGGSPSSGGKKTYKSSELEAVEEQIAKLPFTEKAQARKDLLDAFKEGRVKDD